MNRCLIYLVLLLSAFPALSQGYLPREVQHFIERREGCDHMRGEIDRVNAVSREIRKLCGGTDTELVQLKRKYAANSTIMQILNQFEAGIEIPGAAEVPTPAPASKKRKVKRAT